ELEEAILAQDVSRPSSVVSGEEIASKRSTRAPKLSKQLTGDLDTIVLKALRKAPAARYATAEAFAQDIERYLHGQPVTAQPDSASSRPAQIRRCSSTCCSGSPASTPSSTCSNPHPRCPSARSPWPGSCTARTVCRWRKRSCKRPRICFGRRATSKPRASRAKC